MYKSDRAIALTYAFLGFTLLSIFLCMTIIAASQKIIAESNRCMMFEEYHPENERKDARLRRAVIVQTKRLTDGVAVAFEARHQRLQPTTI